MTKSILIVDDSRAILDKLEFILTENSYKVIRAEDGEMALTLLSQNVVNLIITDIVMPKIDGITLIKMIRKDTRHQLTPILVLTSEVQISGNTKEEAKAAGATGWVIKPFIPEKLLAAIKRIIR